MSARSVTISGKSYDAACDPNASAVPTEERWPNPSARRQGRGWSYTYAGLTPEMAEQIISHLRDVGTSLAHYASDPDARAEGRQLLRDAARAEAKGGK